MRSVSTFRRTPVVGAGIACALVAAETLLLYPLGEVAPSVSLGVVYLVGVLIVAIVWGAWPAVATSFVSAAAFNFFHIPPTGRFTIAEAEDLVALVVFLIAALIAASLADAARHRAQEAEQLRREADLAAELARVLLGAPEPCSALGPAAQRIAQAFGLRSCRIVLDSVGDDTQGTPPSRLRRPAQASSGTGARSAAIPLTRGERRLGTLLVPHDARVVGESVRPALETLLAAALEREALTREVVETRALRRSDEIKTAVLRAVSHDLRSPITAIVTSAEALASPALRDDERQELAAGVTRESARLARLVDKLLELSRLQAGAAEPHRDWCSVEELLHDAAASAGLTADTLKLVVDRDLPLIHADAGQLERAFANLLENAGRYSGGQPVSVRARVSGGRLLVRVVDRGPGIALSDQERVFEPFFRAEGGDGPGSGLGLAIVKGFVEANGGHVHVESLPGQGTSFVVALPLPERAPAGVTT
jgi:two-component system, OmpR family, sensor histidine kinase KdpD